VHRDLKPGNIKIKPDGTVKVLDFGLAKLDVTQPVPSSFDSTGLADANTASGVIIGTAGYMPPEQLRGKPIDRRADIWAFGVVLYEMLAGRPPFQGETVSDIAAAVLQKEPDWTPIHVSLRRLVMRCLEKDPKRRLRDIGDALWEIEHIDKVLEPQPAVSRQGSS